MFHENQQIGPYTLIRQLGKGGFGEVWLAENRTKFATTQVAVKLPNDENLNHLLIEQEAQLWARASGHPNVLPIIEANEYNGQIVIVSEYSPDGSLKQLLENKGGKLPIEQSIKITIGILKGLGFLHSRKIIHRDLTPDNILLQGNTPRLTDFGISRVLKSTFSTSNIAGKPPYLSPEAFRGQRTTQTDIWSVGVMLYQMLKGGLPFWGDDLPSMFASITEKKPTRLSDDIPFTLQRIVMKSLEKNTEDRYQTSEEMRKELDACLLTYSHPFFIPPTQLSIPDSFREVRPLKVQKEIEETGLDIQSYQELAATEPSLEVEKQVGETQPDIKLDVSKENIVSFLPQEQKVNETVKSLPEIIVPHAIVSPKSKINKLYFAVPAIIFLFLSFVGGGSYLLFSIFNKQLISPDISANKSGTNSADSIPAEVKPAEPLLIPFRKGNKFGYSGVNKNIIIEPKYDKAEPFSEDLAVVSLKDKFGFIDKTGSVVIPIQYDEAESFSEGLAVVSLKDKYGFIDKTGNVVIPIKYSSDFFEIENLHFSEGLAAVSLNDKFGFIDKTGNVVIPIKYDEAEPFSEDLAVVSLKDKYGFIDKTGNVVIPIKYDSAYQFSEGLAAVSLKDKVGFIDKTGDVIIPIKYDFAYEFSEGLANIRRDDKAGFIDKTGKEFYFAKYDSTCPFSEGLACVSVKGKYGFMDKDGNEIIPLKYEDVQNFSNGLALVTLKEKDFYIDKNGTEYYESATPTPHKPTPMPLKPPVSGSPDITVPMSINKQPVSKPNNIRPRKVGKKGGEQ
jgi:serine/threonine protein kinase/uncharacterized membrane-anchored protein